jgi:hypothetical protein
MQAMTVGIANAVIIPKANAEDFALLLVDARAKTEDYVEMKLKDGSIIVTSKSPKLLKKIMKLAWDKGLTVSPRVSVAMVRPAETLETFSLYKEGGKELRGSVVFNENERWLSLAIEVEYGFRDRFAVLTIDTSMFWHNDGTDPFAVLDGFLLQYYRLKDQEPNSMKVEFELENEVPVTFESLKDLPQRTTIEFRVAELIKFPEGGIDAHVARLGFTGDNIAKETNRLVESVAKLEKYIISLGKATKHLLNERDLACWQEAERIREEERQKREKQLADERRRKEDERRRPVAMSLEDRAEEIRRQRSSAKSA